MGTNTNTNINQPNTFVEEKYDEEEGKMEECKCDAEEEEEGKCEEANIEIIIRNDDSEMKVDCGGHGGRGGERLNNETISSPRVSMSDPQHELQYKSKCFSFCYNPYYFCCCDYLPHKVLNYSKVDIPEHVICVSGGDNIMLSRDFNEHVIRNILLPYYDTRLKYIMNTQICWSRAGNIAYTTSSILVGIASVLSFASGTYPSIHMNFIAGSLGLLALVCKEFASYSNTLDHAKVSSVNKLLKQLKIAHELSDTSLDVSSVFSSTLSHVKH